MSLADFFFGKPLATDQEDGQHVGPMAGVPILGLDALSSAAYGPEALLTVLLPIGAAGLAYVTPLTILIVALLAIVFFSYRQTIKAYPGGGGAYAVAKENLGTGASIFAAAALALDYVLNVAVAISAGVGALVSAVPSLGHERLALCLAVLALLTIVNLRGLRATGVAFMLPTYLFCACLLFVIALGAARAIAAGGHPSAVVAPPPLAAETGAVSAWLLVRAFASGCTAMTGVEAVSNGVPMFKPPAVQGARRTLAIIIALLVVFLIGIATLCRAYGVGATPPGAAGYQSVLSELAGAVLGRGVFYYAMMASVLTVLALSANTSFAGFPTLSRILAADRFLPEPFVHRGRRLAFSHGIVVLAVLAGILLVVFDGVTDRLIPLFAIGAFCAFTLSQAGMVAHWRTHREERGARRSLIVNAVGATATGITTLVVLVSKLGEGAWITVLLIGGMIALMRQVRRHYDWIDRVVRTDAPLDPTATRPAIAIVPLRHWSKVTQKALNLALEIAPDVVAVQIITHDREVDDLRGRWRDLVELPAQARELPPPRLVVFKSEYRRLYAPLLRFVGKLAALCKGRQIAVIVPELVEPRWYHYFLHNHAASVIKGMLLFRGGPQIVVVNAPFYLKDLEPEQRLMHGRLRPHRGRLTPLARRT